MIKQMKTIASAKKISLGFWNITILKILENSLKNKLQLLFSKKPEKTANVLRISLEEVTWRKLKEKWLCDVQKVLQTSYTKAFIG